MQRWYSKLYSSAQRTPLTPLQKGGMFSVLFLFLLTALNSNLDTDFGSQFELMLSAVLPSVVVDLTNEERVGRDLTTLTRNPVLDEAARLKAVHMRDNNYFAHFSPEGVSPWYWFDEVEYNYIHAGENLAVFFDDSDDVVQAWMDSPLHRDNILKHEYTEIGLAAVETEHKGYNTVFVVQLFGTPATTPPALEAPPQESIQPVVSEPVVEPVTMTPPETVAQPQAPEPVAEVEPAQEVEVKEVTKTVVEKQPIEDKTVFVANHESTSTIPVTLGSSEQIGAGNENRSPSYPRPQVPQNALSILYVLAALVSMGLIVTSITHATKHAHFTHAVYGIALLFITSVAILFHAYVVQAVLF